MGEAVRIPIYGKRQKLLGYWYLRQQDGETYRVSFRYPGQRHKLWETDEPEDAVSMLYDAYIGYLGKKMAQVDNQLAELPLREYRKHGFRKGWLTKLRKQLAGQRKDLVEEGRKKLGDTLVRLRNQGWPLPPLPPLPWDEIDGAKAATAAWIRPAGDRALHRALPADESDLQDASGELLNHSEDTRGERRRNPDLRKAGSGSHVFKALAMGSGKSRKRSEGATFAQQISQGVWNLPRKGAPDREADPDSDG